MKNNKAMYNDYCEAMKMVERYKHWDYIDNYKDMKREEKLYDHYCDIAYELKEKMLKLKKYAKLTVTKEFPIYDVTTGELTGDIDVQEMQLYVIGKQDKDDIALFICGAHVYTGELVKELGWKTKRINGKIVYDDIYAC